MNLPKCLYAFTEAEGYKDYPAYISVNRDTHGQHSITMRARDRHDLVVTVAVSPEVVAALGRALVEST